MAIINNHIVSFQLINPSMELKDKEKNILYTLTLYHVCILEQFFLDYIDPSLNSTKLANVSPANKGGKGVIRSDYFKENLSLEYIGRVYSKATNELHRANKLGKTQSLSVRAKIAEAISKGGIKVYVLDCNSNVAVEFLTKSAAANALGVSLRTIDR
jgi:hypothetical protein